MSAPRRVLIVDDAPLVASSTARLLELEGWRADVVGDGRAALDRLGATPRGWDVVLLDLVLPDLDGAEVFRGLRGIRPDLPVVLTSGWGDQADVARLVAAGALFLGKPFTLPELVGALGRALGEA